MNSATEIGIEHLQQWVGRESVKTEVIAPFPACAMAGLLGLEDAPKDGDALPLPWHWLYFLDAPRLSMTGVDGHPARGGFLPPVPLARRMWAAGKVEANAPLVIGQQATRRSVVQSVELKEGKSGSLVFVAIGHTIEQGGKRCIEEVQNIVYRGAPTAPTPTKDGEVAQQGEWTSTLTPDAQMLFRYSALTYNGHRIHYDRDYAVHEEFYPALVVQGPLIATLLVNALERCRPGTQVLKFSFRALRPSFDRRLLRLNVGIQGRRAQMWPADDGNFLGMQAEAEFA